MDEIPPLLAELLVAPGPSGFEDAVHAIVRREAAGFGAEVTPDVLGSTTARVRGTGARSHARALRARRPGRDDRPPTPSDPGCSRSPSSAAGGPRAPSASASACCTRDGEVQGVVVAASDDGEPGLGEPPRRHRRRGPGGRAPARPHRRPDRAPVAAGSPSRRTGRLRRARRPGRGLRRARGAAAARGGARRVGRRPRRLDAGGDRHARGRPGGRGGARPRRRRRRRGHLRRRRAGPDPWATFAWAEAQPSSAVPSSARSSVTACSPSPSRSGSRSRSSPARRPRATRTTIFTTGAGVPCGIVCIPLRYMHTAAEIVQLSDVEAASRLVEAYARCTLGDEALVPSVDGNPHARLDASHRRPGYPAWRDPLRHRLRRPHPVREARRRARRRSRHGARLDRDRGRARAGRGRPGRGRLRRHGPGAAGRRRPGARPAGGDRRGDPEGGARRHDQQGVRVVDPRDRDHRPDDPRRPPRRRRHRRDGVDVERSLPDPEGALRLQARQRRAPRPHGLRRAHVDVRRRPHGRAGVARLARARHLPRGPGRVGGTVACPRGRGRGRRQACRGDRPGREARARREHPPRHVARAARGAEAGVRPRGHDDGGQRARRQRRRLVRRRLRRGVRAVARPRDPRHDPRARHGRGRLRLPCANTRQGGSARPGGRPATRPPM